MSTEVFLAGMAAVLLAAILIHAMTRLPKDEADDDSLHARNSASPQGARRK
ncbi:hypothetical protein [Loktanella sp. 3ANDIMAR09]|uniref:hypothetical protein n=1 Tax=Loktanella sp. 3ANDIMAR09 TaxID=1225657 RepID=UPI000AADE416|nr:hypothetical protein [Loktanella sp. 3ANDIMAR09]